MKILYSPKFQKKYKKLPSQIQNLAENKRKVFRKEPFHPTLKTHKLHGELNGCWSFSINYKYRIVFEFLGEDIIKFHSIGDHDIYE